MKKKKLLTIKEARSLVEKQQELLDNNLRVLTKAGLKINRLENEVQSLEGARANLSMMYQSNTSEMLKARERTVEALASVRTIERQCDAAISAAQTFQAQVRGYEAETPGHMIRRGLGRILKTAIKPFTSFFERLKYRVVGRG